jgi:hypothetical protein
MSLRVTMHHSIHLYTQTLALHISFNRKSQQLSRVTLKSMWKYNINKIVKDLYRQVPQSTHRYIVATVTWQRMLFREKFISLYQSKQWWLKCIWKINLTRWRGALIEVLDLPSWSKLGLWLNPNRFHTGQSKDNRQVIQLVNERCNTNNLHGNLKREAESTKNIYIAYQNYWWLFPRIYL